MLTEAPSSSNQSLRLRPHPSVTGRHSSRLITMGKKGPSLFRELFSCLFTAARQDAPHPRHYGHHTRETMRGKKNSSGLRPAEQNLACFSKTSACFNRDFVWPKSPSSPSLVPSRSNSSLLGWGGIPLFLGPGSFLFFWS